MRVLEVHAARREEMVIHLKPLFCREMASMSQPGSVDPRFTLLSLSDGIVVCLCEVGAPAGPSWLMALDVRPDLPPGARRIRHLRPLRSTRKLFVRHTARYLCVGTHSGMGRDCHREWVVHTVDLEANRDLTERPVQLRNFAGSDIGSTVCFEIKDGYLYAISNQTGFRDEEIDWTSYYVCLRFPLTEPRKVEWQRIWRRQHREGPISDTWTDLSLQTDASTGDPIIVESRREWRNGTSENFRTCYSQPLSWRDASYPPSALGNTATAASSADSETTSPLESSGVVPSPGSSSHHHAGLPAYVPLQAYPDDPLAALLDSSCRPNYEPPRKRLRRHFHPEYSDTDPLATRRDFIHSRTKYTTYNLSASAFLDLVNDPPAQSTFFSTPPDRLRLRIGSRKRKSPIDAGGEEVEKGLLYPPEHFDDDGRPIDMSEERFESRGIRLWPPNNAPAELLSLLCPSGHAGKVDAASDERCVVYSTQPSRGGKAGRRPIILISFDPQIRLSTLQKLDVTLASAEQPMIAPQSMLSERRPSTGDRPLSPRTTAVTAYRDQARIRSQSSPWLSIERAMYLDINRGYWLR
ncbi:hypothetical protein VTO42DRAFT_4256 [Malbranchea cinnamomea]